MNIHRKYLTYRVITVLFLIAPFFLMADIENSKLPSKDVQEKVTSKDMALKLKKYLSKTISISLSPNRWENALTILKDAENLEKEGDVAKSSERYFEAGQILLKIEKEHPYKEFKNGNIKLGEILYDKKRRTISFPATVKYNKDMPVEVLVCKPQSERNYETLFISDIRPLHLQTILYLAGCVNGSRDIGDEKIKQGSRLRLFIQYIPQEGKTPIVKRVEEFFYNTETGLPWKQKYWIFVGSNVDKGRLISDLTGESIITWCVGSSIIQPADDDIASGKSHLDLIKNSDIPDKSNVTFIIEINEDKRDK